MSNVDPSVLFTASIQLSRVPSRLLSKRVSDFPREGDDRAIFAGTNPALWEKTAEKWLKPVRSPAPQWPENNLRAPLIENRVRFFGFRFIVNLR